jgi:hypothetical protein
MVSATLRKIRPQVKREGKSLSSSLLQATEWSPQLCKIRPQVTRERIRQIENKAMAKLKDPSRHKTLQPYATGAALETIQGDAGWKSGINRDSSQ